MLTSPLLAQDTTQLIPPPLDSARVALGRVERSVGVLRPADAIKIAVWREKELNGDYLLDSRGFVQIPGLGDILVAGLTPVEVKAKLNAALVRRGIDEPEIAVYPLIRVSVIGEVRNPGLFPVDPGTSLIHLITIAGGPTERANLEKVRVIRDGIPHTVNLRGALSGGAAGRVVLFSNDVVFLDRRKGLTRDNFNFGVTLITGLVSVISLITVLRN